MEHAILSYLPGYKLRRIESELRIEATMSRRRGLPCDWNDVRYKSIRQLCRLAMALFACLPVLSSTSTASEPMSAKELLKIVGLDNAFAGISQRLSVSRQPQLKALAATDPKFRKAWNDAAKSTFVAEKMRAKLRNHLVGTLTPPEQQKILQIFGAGVAKKLADLARKARTPEARQYMLKNAREILATAKSQPERQEIYQEIAKLLNLVERATTRQIEFAIAMSLGVASTMPRDSRYSAEELRSFMERSRPAIAARIRSALAVSMAYRYRSLTIKELTTYKDIIQRNVVRKLYDKLISCYSKVMQETSLDFGRKIAEYYNVRPN